MNLHILLTPEVRVKMPRTTKVTHEWGELTVVFDGLTDTEKGLHCFVEDTKENIIEWLSQFDEVIIGSGSPMMESFKRTHIKESLKK